MPYFKVTRYELLLQPYLVQASNEAAAIKKLHESPDSCEPVYDTELLGCAPYYSDLRTGNNARDDQIVFDLLDSCPEAVTDIGDAPEATGIASVERLSPGAGVSEQVPRDAAVFFVDGNKICCVRPNFVNMQESVAGFGDTFEEAYDDLCRNDPNYTGLSHAKLGKGAPS